MNCVGTLCDDCAAAARRAKNAARVAAYRAADPEKVRAQQAAWRAANPEKVREHRRRHYLKTSEGQNARSAAWRAANPEKVRGNGAAYRAANPEKQKAWRVANPEKVTEGWRQWVAANYERKAEIGRRRRARQLAAATIPFTIEQLAQRLSMYPGCWMCGSEADTIDHVLPLARGGAHCLSNLRPACRSCNSSKGAKPLNEVTPAVLPAI